MTKPLLLLFFSCLQFTILAQDVRPSRYQERLKSVQTSVKEYNYMMQGYRLQEANGFDMKSGYTFSKEYTEYIGGYTFKAKDLLKDDGKHYVGTMILISDSKGNEEYICIPYMNESLMSIHRAHLVQIMKSKKLAQAYSEFNSKRSAFSSALSYGGE